MILYINGLIPRLAQLVLLQHAINTNASLSEIAKRWERDVAGCRREVGACGSEVRGVVIARLLVPCCHPFRVAQPGHVPSRASRVRG
jgi:hypothetical protein